MKISLRFLPLALHFLFVPLFALDQDEVVKICEQPKSVPDFRVFYDENATSEQIDAGLDQILDFLHQNPHRVNTTSWASIVTAFLRLLYLTLKCTTRAKSTLSG